MTSEQKLAAVTAIARKHVAANTKTKAAARKILIREGFYTEEGILSPDYGGVVAPKNGDDIVGR